MASAEALDDTKICNMALGRLGANTIDSFEDDTDTQPEAIQCRIHYAQTRDELIRSHWWRMARARATLSQNAAYTADTTTFEWTYAYDLPTDFLRMKKPFENTVPGNLELRYSYSLEGKQILSNESTMKIRYIKRVTDPTDFDPLFVKVFVIELALKMIIPLGGGGKGGEALRRGLLQDLWGGGGVPGLMSRVRALDKQETNTTGRADRFTWNDARMVGSGDPSKRYS
jgi:hypothetical protein